MISYDGRTFRLRDGAGGATRIGHYHQQDDLVWGEFDGDGIRQGRLIGRCAPDGTLEFAYGMVLADGQVVSGRSVCTPRALEDGRMLLEERFERYVPAPEDGVDYLEEVR